eukprot:7144497-Pyramimonas_sp.AAC.1
MSHLIFDLSHPLGILVLDGPEPMLGRCGGHRRVSSRFEGLRSHAKNQGVSFKAAAKQTNHHSTNSSVRKQRPEGVRKMRRMRGGEE